MTDEVTLGGRDTGRISAVHDTDASPVASILADNEQLTKDIAAARTLLLAAVTRAETAEAECARLRKVLQRTLDELAMRLG